MPLLIDVSVRLHTDMPVWPGSAGIRVSRTMRIADGDAANVTRLDMDVHCGTHLEAPLHFLADGIPLEQMPLDTFLGSAEVVDVGAADSVTPTDLEAAEIPDGTERLLLKTRNSTLWTSSEPAFQRDYVAITTDAAAWLVDRGIRLVGIDYLSIQRYEDGPETHRILMRGGVAILEGLDLARVTPGSFTLVCFPLKVAHAEAAPVRAVLIAGDSPR